MKFCDTDKLNIYAQIKLVTKGAPLYSIGLKDLPNIFALHQMKSCTHIINRACSLNIAQPSFEKC